MAINLMRAAKANAASDIEVGKHYKKEELAGKWLTIERVGLVDKDYIKRGKPVLDDNGEVQHLLWSQFRFKEITDGYFRGFSTLTATVQEWMHEFNGDLEALNAALAETPIQICMRPEGSRWTYDVR